jgi:signal transduction histidine kinase
VLNLAERSIPAHSHRLDGGELLVWLEPRLETSRRKQFLAIASHDLRSPIANARSYAALMASQRMELNERARHCAQVIQRNADRALQLLEECIDLLLGEIGGLDLDRTATDLSEVFARVVENTRRLANAKGVEFSARVPAQLPSSSVDRERLVQATFAYAAHSIGRSQKWERVHLDVRQRPESLLVELRDEADADPAALATAAFDPVGRAIAEGRLGDGFRLGLATAIIEAHGGEVGVRSPAGSGSTFFFVLPL